MLFGRLSQAIPFVCLEKHKDVTLKLHFFFYINSGPVWSSVCLSSCLKQRQLRQTAAAWSLIIELLLRCFYMLALCVLLLWTIDCLQYKWIKAEEGLDSAKKKKRRTKTLNSSFGRKTTIRVSYQNNSLWWITMVAILTIPSG